MRFNVVPLTNADTSLPAGQLTLPSLNALPEPMIVRRLSLNEDVSAVLPGIGPRAALLGILDAHGDPVPLMWGDATTERIQLGATELWEIYNFTEDAHPIHIHQVQFQVFNRQHLVTEGEGVAAPPARLFGDAFPPEPWETGFKDTVIAYPGQVTRVKATFDLPGRFVWHCHILEHEDNEMMRAYEVVAG